MANPTTELNQATVPTTSNDQMKDLFYALLDIIQDHIERGSREAEEIQSEALERVFIDCRWRGEKRD